MTARQEAGQKPQPTRVAPKKDTALQTPDVYFPLKEGAAFTYSRTYADQGYVGIRVMSVSSAEGAEGWVNNRLEGSGEMMALELTARVSRSCSSSSSRRRVMSRVVPATACTTPSAPRTGESVYW